MRRLKSLVRDEDASELVEFAIASSILFVMIFGIIEFCMVMYAGNFVAYAAQQRAQGPYVVDLNDADVHRSKSFVTKPSFRSPISTHSRIDPMAN